MKERWLQEQKYEELSLFWFYHYYIDNGGKYIELEEFENTFPLYVQSGVAVIKNGRPHLFDYNSAIEKIYKHFNGKFAE